MWRRTTVAGKFEELDCYLNRLDEDMQKAAVEKNLNKCIRIDES